MAAQSPICLDPSTDVACVNNRLCYNQLKYNSNSIKQYLRRRSHAVRSRSFTHSVKKESIGIDLHKFLQQNHPKFFSYRKVCKPNVDGAHAAPPVLIRSPPVVLLHITSNV